MLVSGLIMFCDNNITNEILFVNSVLQCLFFIRNLNNPNQSVLLTTENFHIILPLILWCFKERWGMFHICSYRWVKEVLEYRQWKVTIAVYLIVKMILNLSWLIYSYKKIQIIGNPMWKLRKLRQRFSLRHAKKNI